LCIYVLILLCGEDRVYSFWRASYNRINSGRSKNDNSDSVLCEMWAEAEESFDDLKIVIERDRVLSKVGPEDEEGFHNRNRTLEL
jgi:hypothetical protein